MSETTTAATATEDKKRGGVIRRMLAWANTPQEEAKPKRSFGSLVGEAAATAGAAMLIYVLAMYVVSIVTPNAMLMVAELMRIDVNTASAQGIIAYWIAPSAVLLTLVVICTVVLSKAIWRARGRLVARLRSKSRTALDEGATAVEKTAPPAAGRAVRTKKRR